MTNPDAACFTLVLDDGSEVPTMQEFRSALQKGSDEVKIDTLRKIIVSTVNGSSQVSSFHMVVLAHGLTLMHRTRLPTDSPTTLLSWIIHTLYHFCFQAHATYAHYSILLTIKKQNP